MTQEASRVSERLPGGSAADYPYDPDAVPEMLTGLNKLRAVRDRPLAQQLYELHALVLRNETDPGVQERLKRRAEHLQSEELTQLKETSASAVAGCFGQQAEELARTMLFADYSSEMVSDPQALRAFVHELQRIPRHERQRREPSERKGRR